MGTDIKGPCKFRVYPAGSEQPLVLSGEVDDQFCILEKSLDCSMEIDRNASVCIPAHPCGSISLLYDQIKVFKANS